MFYQMKGRSSGPDTGSPAMRWKLYLLAFLVLAFYVGAMLLLSWVPKS